MTINNISTTFLNMSGEARLKLYAPSQVPIEKGINKIADWISVVLLMAPLYIKTAKTIGIMALTVIKLLAR